MAKDILKLKVAESVQDDVNKGIVRIDSNLMYQIGAKPGSIVEIEGERKTVAIVDRAYPSDIGLNIIRMDGIVRRNAKSSIGDVVKIGKAEVKEATKITIAPVQNNIQIQAPPSVFKKGLLGRACTKGDIVSIGGTKSRRTTMSDSPFFEDIFNLLDENFSSSFGFSDIKFIVVDAHPAKTPVLITENTEVLFNPEAVELKESPVPDITYEDIGGLSDELSKIREMVELPLKHPEIFEKLGIDAPKGVLLHGPPGTGKTLLAKAVANETKSNFILINGPEIMGKFYGQSEENIRKTFEDAEKNSPSIIFIDEIDAIAPKRDESKGEVERRVVAQLLALMDGLNSRGKVMVLAATNRPNSIDPALRRPGRFDREIEIGVPNAEGREAILKIHSRNMPIQAPIRKSYLVDRISDLNKENKRLDTKIKKNSLDKDSKDEINKSIKDNKEMLKKLKDLGSKIGINEHENEKIVDHLPDDLKAELKQVFLEGLVGEVASTTHGFVGADLQSLAKEAAMVVLRRVVPDLDLKKDEPIPDEVLNKLVIGREDFLIALHYVRPSAMREVLIEVPNVKWDDIGGLEEVKADIKEAVEWPLKHKDAFNRLGINPPKGVLLYGPPGCGKTLLAKAVANESEANFISVKGPELISKWVGESEKGIREVFDKARQTAPCIIFFDELDAIVPHRGNEQGVKVTERMVNQFLTEMDGVEEMRDVVIIGATNRPDMIDPALLRTGRFDRVILSPLPDRDARKQVLGVHTKKMTLASDVDLDVLADKTEQYTGADIEGLAREAAMSALRRDIGAKTVSLKDFEEALERVMPSVTKEVSDLYESFRKHFSSARAKEFKKGAEDTPNYFG